ncbi:MAG: prepilin peptidase [candidate division Zixibacteria bacterium]|nr:prepilin peptidase [candidate division Zixibacteria bacterium]
MEQFISIWVVLLGLVIGSFLNVVIYRLPQKMSFVMARSVCPHCGQQLKWYHNIPVLSYIFLRGKCAFCGGSISPRYPLVELLNAIFYLYFYWQLGASFNFLVLAMLTSSLLVIFFIDLEHQIIPDSITLSGMVVGLGVSFLPEGIGIINALIGLLAGGGSLYLIAILGDWLFKKESMGGGDIKMAAMLGAFLGWEKVAFIFIAAAAIGLVVSLAVMCFSSKMRQTHVIPFGPFLASAAVLAIICGNRIIHWYLVTVVGITPW